MMVKGDSMTTLFSLLGILLLLQIFTPKTAKQTNRARGKEKKKAANENPEAPPPLSA
jgi:hypothetical protein